MLRDLTDQWLPRAHMENIHQALLTSIVEDAVPQASVVGRLISAFGHMTIQSPAQGHTALLRLSTQHASWLMIARRA